MNIVVTGAAGFIASHVADAYIAAGHTVTVIDNLSSGFDRNIPEGATFIQADITDREKIREILGDIKPDILNLHAAHISVGNSVKDPQFDATSNVLGLLNCLEAVKDHPPKKVLFASTGGAMYGIMPTPFTEDMEPAPISPYGISKRAGELYLHFYNVQYGIPYVALRYSNVYGPRQNAHGESGVVAIFTEKLLAGEQPTINGDGTNFRDYIFVKDVAKANLLALETDYVGPVQIGTQTEYTTNQVFQQIVSALGSDIQAAHGPERPGEQKASSLTYDKATAVLGWKPSVDFETGIAETVTWFKNR